MTIPSAPPTAPPTQVAHPARAVVRTIVAGLIALVPVLPEVLTQTHLDGTVIGAQTIAIAGVITRVLALPAVERLLRRFRLTSWLAAAPGGAP